MKFGKRLKIHLEETLPEWRDKFVAYKRLKKQLKLLQHAPRGFAEGAFIYSNDAANSKVAKVDRQLRNGSEIGHYGPPLELGVLDGLLGQEPQPLEHQQQQHQRCADIGCSLVAAAATAARRSRDYASDVDNDSTSSSSPTPTGEEEEMESPALPAAAMAMAAASSSRKRKAPEISLGGDSDGDGEGERAFDASRFTTNQKFIQLLMMELDKFNTFFCEKEEEYVIRLQELKDRTECFKDRTAHKMHLSEEDVKEMTTIYTDMITFHGEMVLLMNYSSLNYTGLVKILKKHDKQTGGVLRTPFIQYVLHQPFYTTELLSQLVSDCETNLSSLFPLPQPASLQARSGEQAADSSSAIHTPDTDYCRAHSPCSQPAATSATAREQHEAPDASRPEDNLDGVYKGVVAALQTIKDIRRGSSTYTALSMPPLELPDGDDNSLGVVIDERVLRDSPPPPSRNAAVSVSQD